VPGLSHIQRDPHPRRCPRIRFEALDVSWRGSSLAADVGAADEAARHLRPNVARLVVHGAHRPGCAGTDRAITGADRKDTMPAERWPQSIDDVVERTRFSAGDDDWWESAEKVIAGGIPADQMRYLAHVGLVELVTQSHRVGRNGKYPCAGLQIVYATWPNLKPAGIDDEELFGH
jgi:hypothetical protein